MSNTSHLDSTALLDDAQRRGSLPRRRSSLFLSALDLPASPARSNSDIGALLGLPDFSRRASDDLLSKNGSFSSLTDLLATATANSSTTHHAANNTVKHELPNNFTPPTVSVLANSTSNNAPTRITISQTSPPAPTPSIIESGPAKTRIVIHQQIPTVTAPCAIPLPNTSISPSVPANPSTAVSTTSLPPPSDNTTANAAAALAILQQNPVLLQLYANAYPALLQLHQLLPLTSLSTSTSNQQQLLPSIQQIAPFSTLSLANNAHQVNNNNGTMSMAPMTNVIPVQRSKSTPYFMIRGARKSIFSDLDTLETLNSLPYKYCFRLIYPLENEDGTSRPVLTHEALKFSLLCIDPEKMAHEYAVDNGLTMEKIMKSRIVENAQQLEFKVSFSAFSHGYNRNGFVIELRDTSNHNQLIYKSKKILIFARRKRRAKKNKMQETDIASNNQDEPFAKKQKTQ